MAALAVVLEGIGFNDNTAYLGAKWWITNLVGWDQPMVRAATGDRVADHGGFTGIGYFEPRTLVIGGKAIGTTETTFWQAWNGLPDALSGLMTVDGSFVLTENAVAKRLFVRIPAGRAVRTSITGVCTFDFEVTLVADDPFKYSEETTTALNATINNIGNFDSKRATITFTGSGTNVVVTNTSITGSPAVHLDSVASGDVLDLRRRTFKSSAGVNKFDQVDLTSTTWWYLLPGNNVLTRSGATATITYRSAWL